MHRSPLLTSNRKSCSARAKIHNIAFYVHSQFRSEYRQTDTIDRRVLARRIYAPEYRPIGRYRRSQQKINGIVETAIG